MNTVNKYIHTSVQDAKVSLDLLAETDAVRAAQAALELLEELRKHSNQVSRQKVAASALRKAARAIAASEELDPRGTKAGDTYAEMPTGELREWITLTIDDDPVKAARDMLSTLISLRGEYGTTTRRKMLATGLGKAASELVAA